MYKLLFTCVLNNISVSTMKHNVLLVVLLSFFVYGIEAKSAKEEWKHYKTEFNKTYESNEEDQNRYKIFKENVKNIQKHNKRFETGEETYLQEVNRFADLTDDEFTALYGLYERSHPVKYTEDVNKTRNETDEYLDWRTTGGFTPAKDQGRCGACYIFSVTANIENYHFRKTGQLLALSEQYVVDCIPFNDTCGGGNPGYVFAFVELFGIHLESDYPYQEEQQTCQNETQPRSNVTFLDVGVVLGSDEDLKLGLKEYGPLTTCFSVTSNWRFYKSGVWYHDECAEASNHCVLIVGYGTENENDFWLIRNSWGPHWGDNGYIKMARNKHQSYCGFKAGLYLI